VCKQKTSGQMLKKGSKEQMQVDLWKLLKNTIGIVYVLNGSCFFPTILFVKTDKESSIKDVKVKEFNFNIFSAYHVLGLF